MNPGPYKKTSTPPHPGGRLIFHIFASLTEFERHLIKERTHAGLAAARARGRTGGRPPSLTDDQITTARKLYDQQDMTAAQIGEVLGVSHSTTYQYYSATLSPPGLSAQSIIHSDSNISTVGMN